MTRPVLLAVAAAAASMTFGAAASQLSIDECVEGSDFIANAAHARDNGKSRLEFMGRLEDDLVLIQAFPPELRWFAKDPADEAFLRESARQVFDAPAAPEQHRKIFLAACLNRGMA